MTEVITTRREGAILEVTLDRPKANAIDLATSRLMGKTFAAFRDDPTLRVAILQTAGDKFFSAGWDLKAAAAGDAVDGDYGEGGFGGLQQLQGLNKPVIAAVNGMAVGGGFELALSCDLIYASDHSSFALPEIKAGTLADAATIKLPKRMPYHVAMDLLLTGRWMDVAEAHRWGLVNEVLPKEKLMDRVWEIARLLAVRPAAGLRRDQGSGAGGGGQVVYGGDGAGDQAQAADGGCAVWVGGQYGRLQGFCGEARAGLEGAVVHQDRKAWAVLDPLLRHRHDRPAGHVHEISERGLSVSPAAGHPLRHGHCAGGADRRSDRRLCRV